MITMQLILTKHVQDQMILRGIDKEQIIRAIQRGAKVRQTDGLLAIYAYIRVAYKTRGDKYIIKTVMVD